MKDEAEYIDRQFEQITKELNESRENTKLQAEMDKATQGVSAMSSAIDDLRREILGSQQNFSLELKEIKETTKTLQSTLADLRQSQFELNNDLKTMPLDHFRTKLLSLEESLAKVVTAEQLTTVLQKEKESNVLSIDASHIDLRNSIMEDVQKLCLNSQSRLEGKDLPTEKSPESESQNNVACQTGFSVSDYEYSSLLRAAEEAHSFAQIIPKLEGQVQNITLELGRQEEVVGKARSFIAELKEVTETQAYSFYKAKREQENAHLIEVNRHRRANKTTNKQTNLALAHRDIRERERQIGLEIEKAAPKVEKFIRGWNSLKAGDIFCFKGLSLTIDSTFNPSLRIKHSGQNGDKWEAQKYANGVWYERGYVEAY